MDRNNCELLDFFSHFFTSVVNSEEKLNRISFSMEFCFQCFVCSIACLVALWPKKRHWVDSNKKAQETIQFSPVLCCSVMTIPTIMAPFWTLYRSFYPRIRGPKTTFLNNLFSNSSLISIVFIRSFAYRRSEIRIYRE